MKYWSLLKAHVLNTDIDIYKLLKYKKLYIAKVMKISSEAKSSHCI